MDPSIKAYIADLRRGRSSVEAFETYCWTKSVVLIEHDADVHGRVHPMQKLPVWRCMAEAMGWDAFKEGADDEAIAAAFLEGKRIDQQRGYVFRVMRKDERPSTGDLLRAMSDEDRMTAAELFGIKRVAATIAYD